MQGHHEKDRENERHQYAFDAILDKGGKTLPENHQFGKEASHQEKQLHSKIVDKTQQSTVNRIPAVFTRHPQIVTSGHEKDTHVQHQPQQHGHGPHKIQTMVSFLSFHINQVPFFRNIEDNPARCARDSPLNSC